MRSGGGADYDRGNACDDDDDDGDDGDDDDVNVDVAITASTY